MEMLGLKKLAGWFKEPSKVDEKVSLFEKPAEKRTRHDFGRYLREGLERQEESEKALAEWSVREVEAFRKYKPKGAAFRIRQVPSGEFIIERRQVRRAKSFWYGMYSTPAMINSAPVEPTEEYESVKNPDAPITSRGGSGYWAYDHERVTGYSPMIFNTFAAAEDYLKGMVTPETDAVYYDFPPLKKRAPKASRAQAKKNA